MSDNEAVWIKQAIHGDDRAFGFLVDQFQKPVYSLCYRMLGNSRDAEDAAQESFIRAYTHLKRYDPQRAFATWLLSIGSHYCIDQIRKRHLPVVPIEALPAEILPDQRVPNPESSTQRAEKEQMIQALLLQLQPLDRAAIIFRYWHDYSEVEIAQTLDLTVSAVKSRLYRARQTLAKAWLAEEQSTFSTERRPNESPAL